MRQGKPPAGSASSELVAPCQMFCNPPVGTAEAVPRSVDTAAVARLQAGSRVGHSMAGAFQPGLDSCGTGAAAAAAAVAVLVVVAMPVSRRVHVTAAPAADRLQVTTPMHLMHSGSDLQHVELLQPRCEST